MSAHLGRSLSAFLDGELDHGQREQIQVHLAHCVDCRAELAGLRMLKGVLRSEAQSFAPPDLASRVLARTAQPGHLAPVASARTSRRPLAGSVRRSAGVVGAFAFGAGAALLVAGPPPAAPPVLVDPTSAGLILEHVSTANEVPFAGPDAMHFRVPFAGPNSGTVTAPVANPVGLPPTYR